MITKSLKAGSYSLRKYVLILIGTDVYKRRNTYLLLRKQHFLHLKIRHGKVRSYLKSWDIQPNIYQFDFVSDSLPINLTTLT